MRCRDQGIVITTDSITLKDGVEGIAKSSYYSIISREGSFFIVKWSKEQNHARPYAPTCWIAHVCKNGWFLPPFVLWTFGKRLWWGIELPETGCLICKERVPKKLLVQKELMRLGNGSTR